MGKLSNMLYMIDLLNTGNIYTIKELSEKLGVSERMIRYYKEEILKNGIYIESFKGPNGGYFMIDKIKNYTSINKYDVQLLEYSYKILEEENFEFINKFKFLLEKIKNMNNICEEKSKFISNINLKDDIEIEKTISNAIDKLEKIDIIYSDIKGKNQKRTIHPLQLFRYKDDNYVTAYCELRNEIRHFEIGRIVEIR